MTLLLVVLIGFLCGFRSLTPTAVIAWAGYAGWIQLHSPLSWIGTLPAAIVFTLLASGELFADKHPKTPNRTSPPGLIARIVMGALAGASLGLIAGQTLFAGALIGAAGAVAGTFAGFYMRKSLVRSGLRDLHAALLEDLITIAGSLLIVSRF